MADYPLAVSVSANASRPFVIIAFAEELAARPELLRAYADSFAAGEPALLAVYAPGYDPGRLEALLAPLVSAYGLASEESPEVVGLALAGEEAHEGELVGQADCLLSDHAARAPFAVLPRVGSSCDGCLRALAEAVWRRKPLPAQSVPSTGVVVLGMHRSGTSAVTRVLDLMGLSLGDPAELMAPQPDNPRGFWEHSKLVRLNDELLAEFGGSWLAPPPLAPGWVDDPRLEPLRARAVESFRALHRTNGWLWKDPRTSLTLPFWIECLGVRPVVVLVFRNPLAVAQSLISRSRLSATPAQPTSKAHALALWERYNRAALESAAGLPTLVTAYEALLEDPSTWCESTRSALAELGVHLDAPPMDAIEAFLDRSLCHSAATLADLAYDAETSKEQRRLAGLLESLSGVHPALARQALGPETHWVEPLLDGHRRTGSVALSATELRVASRPVFVVGAPRSGTSMMQHALRRHPAFWGGEESDFLGPLARAVCDAHRFGTSRGAHHWLHSQGVSVDELLRSVGWGINALYTSRSGGRRWVEQTPEYTKYLDLLGRMFPDAQFVAMLRDGRDVVHSLRHFQVWPKGHAEACCLWREHVESMLAYVKSHPERILVVRHERVVSNPEAELRRVFRFLGEEYAPESAALIRDGAPINSSFSYRPGERPGGRWQTEWTHAERAEFQELAGDLLVRLGFEPADETEGAPSTETGEGTEREPGRCARGGALQEVAAGREGRSSSCRRHP